MRNDDLDLIEWWVRIRLFLKLHFAILVGEEKHLTRRVDSAAV